MSAQPSPTLLTETGHSLLRSVIAGHGAHRLAAAEALHRLKRMLTNASAEARLVTTLMVVRVAPACRANSGFREEL